MYNSSDITQIMLNFLITHKFLQNRLQTKRNLYLCVIKSIISHMIVLTATAKTMNNEAVVLFFHI